MNHEQVLVALYDLMLTLSGEVKVEPLTANFLRRMLYHTGFACAVFLRLEGEADAQGRVPVKVCQALGSRALSDYVGQSLRLPAAEVLGESACLEGGAALSDLFEAGDGYDIRLRLRVGGLGTIFLFTAAKPAYGDDLALIFAPVLDRFEQAYRNCQLQETYAAHLEREAEERRRIENALRESERQLWQLIEFAPLAMAVFDRDERTHYLNSKFIELFGYTPHDIPSLEAWGRKAFADPQQYAQIRKQWQDALAQGEKSGAIPPLRVRLPTQGGERHLFEVRGKRFDDRVMMLLVDLELEEQRKRLPDALDTKRQRAAILSDISHALYTPLNAILGHAQLLQMEEGLTPAQRESVEQIVLGGQQLLEIIDQGVKAALTTPDDAGSGEGAPPPVRLLVAEDYAPNRQLLERQLERLGYAADFVENGAEALQRWQEGDYALILTDCNMPVLDGLELTARVREAEASQGGHIPIIAITANTLGEEVERCLAVGMDDFLAKPVQLQELERTLERWLKRPARGVAPRAPIPAADEDEISLRRLATLLGEDDPHELLRLLEIFARSVEELMAEASVAAGAADLRQLAQAMHKLKSSARTIGAMKLAKQAQDIELAARAWDWARVGQALPELKLEAEQVVAQIRALLVAPMLEAVDQKGRVAKVADVGLSRLTVLLVDDDAFIREQVAASLRRMGVAEPLLAAEGGEALALLDSRHGAVDVIITDLNMPGMDGVEFIRHLQARQFKGRLILISGEDSRVLATVKELAESQGLWVPGSLTKPVAPAALYELLGRQEAGRTTRPAGVAGPQVTVEDVRQGIERGEFTVFFQPKVEAASLRVVGVEALARWIRPGQGLVSPGVFIPLAEGSGLIEPLTMALLTRAIEQAGALHRAGHPLKVAVNYSALAFGNLQVPEFIVEQAAKAGIEPKHLIMEVTESGLMSDPAVALDVLTRLRLKGVNLSIDDFGTGYSSMDQLRRIPFSELKIDQGFVHGASRDPLARSILESSVEIAKRLKLVTVAEGVEDEDDLALVRRAGCDLIQGYYIAKPMALEDLLAWLAQYPVPAAT